jgi:Fic family protein
MTIEIVVKHNPPFHKAAQIESALKNVYDWLTHQDDIHPLIKAGIFHHEFAYIHPFFDGNGRIGRLLIALQLVDSDILTKPTLYLSAFFEKNRNSYYDSLTMVRQTHNLEQWVKFFLNGVIDTANAGISTFKKVISLRQQYEDKIMTLGSRAKNAQKLLYYMFSRPIVNNKIVQKKHGISFNSANRLIKSLTDLGLLEEITGHSRNRLFVLKEYLELFKK